MASIVHKLKSNQSLLTGIFVFVGIFILYYVTRMTRVVPYGDSGEIVTATHLMYPAHAPGYPIYIVVFKLLSTLLTFIGEVYERHSVATGIIGAMNGVLLFSVIRILFKSRLLALIGTIAMNFCLLTWVYHVVPEVFSLANTVLLLQILTLLLWDRAEDRGKQLRNIYFFSILLGIGFVSHWITVLAWPGYFFHILSVNRRDKRKYSLKPYLISSVLAVVGVSSSLLFFYLATHIHPPFFNVEPTWESFLEHFFRKNYAWGTKAERTFKPVLYYAQYTFQVWSGALVFGIVGLFGAGRQMGKYGFALLGFLTTGVLGLYYQNMPVDSYVLRGLAEKFYLCSYYFFAILVCIGLHMTNGFVRSALSGSAKKVGASNQPAVEDADSGKNHAFGLASLRYNWFYIVILVASIALFPGRNFQTMRAANDRISVEAARRILDMVPDNSIIFAGEDQFSFPLLYQVNVKEYRKKRLVLLPGAFSRVTNYGNFKKYIDYISFKGGFKVNRHIIKADLFLRDFLDVNRDTPIFFTAPYYRETVGMMNHPYNVEPYGLLLKLIYDKPTGKNVNRYEDFLIDKKYLAKKYDLPGALATQELVVDGLWNALDALELNGVNEKAWSLVKFINGYAPGSKLDSEIQKRLKMTKAQYENFTDKRATDAFFRPTQQRPLNAFIQAKSERIQKYKDQDRMLDMAHEIEDLIRYDNQPLFYGELIKIYVKMGHDTAVEKWIGLSKKNFPEDQKLMQLIRNVEGS